jgi:hypothetical protein
MTGVVSICTRERPRLAVMRVALALPAAIVL